MKYYSYFLFLIQILSIHSSIPNWNIDNLSEELFSSSSTDATYPYGLYNSGGYVLNKIITKKADGTFSIKNELTYNSVTKEVSFDGIESTYDSQLGSEKLVCPKGSFHPYDFYNNYYIKPFTNEGNWELSCYKHDTGYFLVFYTHNGNSVLHYVKGNNRSFKSVTYINEL